MNDLKTECEKSFYRELYQLGEKNQWIVVELASEKLYLRKSLTVYNEEVLRYLSEHFSKHLPRVRAFWKEEDGTLTLIEEYVQGETLSVHLQRGDLSEGKKKEIVLSVLDALSFLHLANPPIIHRDVKPDNIMLGDNGSVYLVDFDAAKVHRHGEKRDTVLLGTEGIAAPEQYGFAQSDMRTDLYAVGMLIRELFPEDAAMDQIAEKATRMDPKDRYQNAVELKEAFLNAYGGAEWTAEGARKAEVSGHPHGKGEKNERRGMKILVGILLAVVGVQVLFAFVFFSRVMENRNGEENAAEEGAALETEDVIAPKREEAEKNQAEENIAGSGEEVTATEQEEAEKNQAEENIAGSGEEVTATEQEEAEKNQAEENAARSGEEPAAAEQEENDVTETDAKERIFPELLESGYSIAENRAYFGVVVRNPSTEYAMTNVIAYATVKGKNGEILASDRVRIRYIAAGDTVFFGSSDQLSWEDAEGKTLEISLQHRDQDVILQAKSGVLRLNELPVTNTSALQEKYWVRHTGEVENLSGREVQHVCITGVYRKNGKIVGGWYEFIENLGTDEKRVFDTNDIYYEGEFDSCEVCALEWNKS